MRKLWVMLIIVALITLGQIIKPEPAFACSGDGPTWEEIVNDSTVIVQATIKQIDASHYNGIVEVKRYLKGTTTQRYLLLEQAAPIWYVGEQTDFWGSGGCRVDGVPLDVGDEVILLLIHNSDGSYTPTAIQQQATSVYPIYPQESQQTEQLVRKISDLVKRTSYLPAGNTILPRTAEILITTETGSHYRLPVDQNIPVKLPDEAIPTTLQSLQHECPQRNLLQPCSANAVHQLYTVRMATFGIDIRSDLAPAYGAATVPGNAFLVSNSGMQLAVWLAQRIDIYTLGIGEGRSSPRLVATLPVTNAKPDRSAASLSAVWSMDDHFLTYSDDHGLWLWDMTAPQNQPKRLLQAHSPANSPSPEPIIPRPDVFSPRDTYLSITDGDHQFTLNILTDQKFPSGVLSPDEQHLLTNRPIKALDYAPAVCLLTIALCGTEPASYRYTVQELA